ncbi:MAG: M28 family peptidase [Chitinophagaceae bacterium]|nr:M28 family peptidase [Chitinophagaceae bacterium]
MKINFFIFILFLSINNIAAQDIEYAKKTIETLSSKEFAGRGYIDNGVNTAADFLAKEFKKNGLQKIGRTYFQEFSYPVNTFPTPTSFSIDDKKLVEGQDYLIVPSSDLCKGKYKIIYFDLDNEMDSVLFEKKIGLGFENDEVLAFKSKKNGFHFIEKQLLLNAKKPALLIKTVEKKLTYTVSTSKENHCHIETFDSLIKNGDYIEIQAKSTFEEDFKTKNIIGYISPNKKNKILPNDSFIVFTAHYDHLGKMGNAIFPGASDNASGVSMLLMLSNYFSKNKLNYPVVFILFSGEEAGLLGSNYFVNNPTFDIQKIKLLLNIDIMGSAENGIVVVNGSEYPQYFDKIKSINEEKKYTPEVRIRGKAKNSDHYYFSEKNIPALFIYSNGGPGFYHDVFDKANSLTLQNYMQVYQLFIDFANEISK